MIVVQLLREINTKGVNTACERHDLLLLFQTVSVSGFDQFAFMDNAQMQTLLMSKMYSRNAFVAAEVHDQ